MGRIIDGAQTNIVGKQVKKFRKERGLSQQLLSQDLKRLQFIYVEVQFQELKNK